LIRPDEQATLIFIEVRARNQLTQGGAAASITLTKQRRIVRAAQHYLMQWNELPACRFDVVVIEGDEMKWFQAAFEAVL
jgi:putative endonuclease